MEELFKKGTRPSEIRKLREHFVKSYDLNIGIVIDPYFEYFLDLYEKDYHAKTYYREFISFVQDNFDSSPLKYLDFRGRLDNDLVNSIKDTETYSTMVKELDRNKYKLSDELKNFKSNLYNDNNHDKIFLSIDIKDACFQTLKFYDDKIFSELDCSSRDYVQFLLSYIDVNDYDKDFKTRIKDYVEDISIVTQGTQVTYAYHDYGKFALISRRDKEMMFGKLNNSCTLGITRYLISNIFTQVKTYIYNMYGKTLDETNTLINNDEIIINFTDLDMKYVTENNNLLKDLYFVDEKPIHVKAEMFVLTEYKLFSNIRLSESDIFYEKTFIHPRYKKNKLKKCPSIFFPQLYKKLIMKETSYINKFDLSFEIQGQMATFDSSVILKEMEETVNE